MRRYLAVPLLLLLLTGCTSSAQDPTSTPTATPTSTPTPTPTPSPTPDAAPVYTDNTADWIITYTGIGPIEFSQPFSQIVSSIPSPDRLTEACPPLMLYTSGIQPQVGVAHADDVPWDLVVATFGREPLTDQAPHTAEGIRVGSTEADILAVYPDALLNGDASYGAYVITNGTGGYITFAMSEGTVQGIHVSDHASAPKEYCG
ncbi:hypothetical protein ITJ38_01260 [Agreia pratensis]|uniref:hypothetical protein n=1 Tax=Agreia pratensis TaxID=150121 RepID=UPI00188CA897|nr:hypothetical protein [Agreia pratensis]MBF4633026.1 hypothetical protein [Agreia pratensis]